MSLPSSSERPQRTTKNKRPSRYNNGADEDEILQASQEFIPSKKRTANKKEPSRFNEHADKQKIIEASQELIPLKKRKQMKKGNCGGSVHVSN